MSSGRLFDDDKDLPIEITNPKIDRAWAAYHKKFPMVYKLFARFTRQAIRAGRKRFGARLIWERMRWYTLIEARDLSGYKLNDHYPPYYARLCMRDNPRYRGLFNTRERQPRNDR